LWLSRCAKSLFTFFIVLLGSPFVSRTQTDFSPGDAANFAVMYDGDGKQLQFNNSIVTGNIGIGSINGTTGQFQGNGPWTITVTVEFNNSSGAFSNSGLAITGNGGNRLYNQTNINFDLTAISTPTQRTLSRSSGNIPIRPAVSAVTLSLRHATRHGVLGSLND